MNKLETFINGDWIGHVHHRVFSREQTTGPERLQVGIPPASADPVRVLLALMPEPFFLLYVLHTPRGAEPGRYQSPELSRAQVEAFLDEFGEFLTRDARHDLCIHSPTANATLVWDRHDVLYAYGPLASFSSALECAGYTPGVPSIPCPHRHLYHSTFDPQQHALLNAFDWYRSELRPEDEQ